MPIFTPNRPISYDNVTYQPDVPFEVSEEWGRKLADRGYGVLEVTNKKPPDKTPSSEKSAKTT